MYRLKAELLASEKVAPEIYKLRLFSEKVASKAKPGQFIHIKCGDKRSYLLRRPMSIHRVTGRGIFEILFKVVGDGTSFLASEKLHKSLDILGPLGNGFKVKKDLSSAVVIAGGIGIAPLLFLIDELLKKGVKIHVLLGAQDNRKLLYVLDLKRVVKRVHTTTDDGSVGHKGPVTDLLPEVIEQSDSQQVFACGPQEMLKKVARICKQEEVPCQVSLEGQMACGVGVCLGCVLRIRNGGEECYSRVCTEGPVFEAERVIWEEQ